MLRFLLFHLALNHNHPPIRLSNDGATVHENSFHDIGSAIAKVLAMFTGELGFETAFVTATSLGEDPFHNVWVIILYAGFVLEMCVILANLTIALAISNIQDMKVDADALRLVKEVMLQR